MRSLSFPIHDAWLARIRCYCGLMLILVCASNSKGQEVTDNATDRATVLDLADDQFKNPAGRVRKYDDLQVETKVAESGIKISFRVDGRADDEISENVAGARGVATLKVAGEAKRYRYDLLPNGRGDLVANANLVRIRGKHLELEVLLGSLPSSISSRETLRFRETISIAPSPEQLAADAIARQATCPVSGKRLGSMGSPVAVALGKDTIYTCCKGCVQALQSEPSQFSRFPKELSVIKPTAADANAIARQRVCPVMDEPLDAMGGPYRVNAAGRIIYICCPGCAGRISSDPSKYVAKLRERGIEAPRIR